MNRGYLACDPGSPLTLALINPLGKWVAHAGEDLVSFKDKRGHTNSPELIVHLIKKWDDKTAYPLTVVIENVGPMPGEGIMSAAKFAGSIWLMRTAAIALGIPYVMVTPQKWKKHYGLAKEKDLARQKALHLWPERADWIKFKKNHDRAEAALMGKYGLELNL